MYRFKTKTMELKEALKKLENPIYLDIIFSKALAKKSKKSLTEIEKIAVKKKLTLEGFVAPIVFANNSWVRLKKDFLINN